MKNKKEVRLLFCFVIYIILFISIAFYPPNRNMFHSRVSIIKTLYYSNLLYPFIANTLLLLYYLKDDIKKLIGLDYKKN